MGGAGTSPPPRRPAATRGAVGARGAYVTCQVSIQVCFEIYSRFETQMFVSSGEVPDLRIAQPPVGGRRGDGQARDGVDPVPLLSLVGWVCSSSAQKEAKNSAATLSVSFLDTPSSTALKSWLVVARDASARVQLVRHLGWVHRQEARAVGRPRERMGGRR